METDRDPRPALAAFYAMFFANMGIVLPFLPPWIRDLGFGPVAIGVLLAVQPAAKLIAPWTWGRWADRSGLRRQLLVVAMLAAAAALVVLGGTRPRSFAALLGLLLAYAFASAPGLPFAEATAMEQSEHRRFAYGPVRLWGSISFMVLSSGFGLAFDRVGGAVGLVIAAGFLVCASAAAAALPPPEPSPPRGATPRTSTANGDRRGAIARLFAACALMQASHGGYYAFYSIHLEEMGYRGAAIGTLWAFAVLCEIVLLTRIDGVIGRLGSSRVMRLALVAAALRWVVIAAATTLVPLVLAQTLHALTYAAFHVAALREVHRRFPAGSRATGQALYSGLTYGLGTFVGTLLAGRVAAAIELRGMFVVSAMIAVLGIIVLPRADGTRRNPD